MGEGVGHPGKTNMTWGQGFGSPSISGLETEVNNMLSVHLACVMEPQEKLNTEDEVSFPGWQDPV